MKVEDEARVAVQLVDYILPDGPDVTPNLVLYPCIVFVLIGVHLARICCWPIVGAWRIYEYTRWLWAR